MNKDKQYKLDERYLRMAHIWAENSYCKRRKVGAIIVKDKMIIGTGAGQMSRVDSVDIAIKKAGDRAKGSVCASDAFFPFRDGVDTLAQAGITSIIQPGGSIRDKDVITAVDEHKISMVFTGIRSFKH